MKPPGHDLKIRCTCGALRGLAQGLSASSGNHVVCYCDDCQAFAHFLSQPSDVLDAHGGTEIFQMSPAKLVITDGDDQLACMRLSERGMLRWYSNCCNTPIGNTLAAGKIPFVGLIHRCIEVPADASNALDRVLGPVRMRGFRKFAKGDANTIPADGAFMPIAMLRVAGLMLTWKLQGDALRSPFFQPENALPVVAPRVLSPAERAELRSAVARA